MTHSKSLARALTALWAAIVAVALLAPAASAQTAEGFEQFAGCPDAESVPICLRSEVTGGHFQMGSKTVEIENPITLSGGINTSEEMVFNSEGGLEPVKQEVPGGVVGITGLDWLVDLLGAEALELHAITELAGTPGFPIEQDPFSLPIKVHLVNPVLGNNCYVGSNTNPIALELTTGTTDPPPPNEPISGKFPTPTSGGGITFLDNGIFVDNAFAAPAATGCVLTLAGIPTVNIDSLVNTQAGLPSDAGTNETVQEFDGELTRSFRVYP